MILNCQLKKEERLTSQLVIDQLFAGGNASMAAFPLRIVYMRVRKQGESLSPVSVLVSVPKRRFRHAVDRNRMKRLIREAYRLNKHILCQMLEGKDERMILAFICIADVLPSFYAVNKSMRKVLTRIAETVG